MRAGAAGYSGFALPRRRAPMLPSIPTPPPFHREIAFLTASGSTESRAAARPARPPRQERIPLGILYMIIATALFAGSSAISKLLVVTYSVGEILFSRCAVGLVCVAV